MNVLPLAVDVVYRSDGTRWSGWFGPSTLIVVLVIVGIALFLKFVKDIHGTLVKCLLFIAVALTVVWGILLFLFVLDRVFGVTF